MPRLGVRSPLSPPLPALLNGRQYLSVQKGPPFLLPINACHPERKCVDNQRQGSPCPAVVHEADMLASTGRCRNRLTRHAHILDTVPRWVWPVPPWLVQRVGPPVPGSTLPACPSPGTTRSPVPHPGRFNASQLRTCNDDYRIGGQFTVRSRKSTFPRSIRTPA